MSDLQVENHLTIFVLHIPKFEAAFLGKFQEIKIPFLSVSPHRWLTDRILRLSTCKRDLHPTRDRRKDAAVNIFI